MIKYYISYQSPLQKDVINPDYSFMLKHVLLHLWESEDYADKFGQLLLRFICDLSCKLKAINCDIY